MNNNTVQQLRERIAQLEAGPPAPGSGGSGSWSRPVDPGGYDWVGALGAGAPRPGGSVGNPPADRDPSVDSRLSLRASVNINSSPSPTTDASASASPGADPAGGLAGIVASAVELLTEVSARPLSLAAEGDLAAAVEHLGRLARVRDRLLLGMLTELAGRGVTHPGGLSPVDALRALDPGLSAPAAKAVTSTAEAFGQPRWADLRERVHTGEVTVAAAAKIVGFYERTHLVADPGEVERAVTDLTARAGTSTLEQLSRWVRHYTETVLPPGDLDALEGARRAARGLWIDPPCATGMVTGRFQLDPEAAATLRAAIDPLAAPRPTRGPGGETVRDPRSPATRRVDAMLQVIGRGVASPGAAPSTDKAKILVTIEHDVLSGRVRGTGTTLTGEVLTPATVRRLACDAQIIPAVLGTKSAPLDLGRGRRLFPPSLRSALWLRDVGCTYPDCTAPPTWCDAHHVTHWVDGGPTTITNAALLCPRHHDHVHHHELTATVTHGRVTWHL